MHFVWWLIAGILAILPSSSFAWGFWAHQRINRLAVFTLPPEMLVLYKKHIDYLTNHAVDPDKRRYAVEGEAARHFIDLDRYGAYPFPDMPRRWDEAVAKLTEDTLQAHGIVVWELPRQVWRLKQAFEDRDLRRIIKLSADLGHYVGDAHVPLHTTKNYNGQFTGQKGIHGFWESRLPELFAEQYDFWVGRSFFIDNLGEYSWRIVLESHIAVDSVLGLEQELNDRFPADRKYGYESRNNVVMRMYSRDYAAAYHQLMGGMVERRMRAAIRRTGAYWYTAWKLAGSPDLSALAKETWQEIPEPFPIRLKILDRESQEIGCCYPGKVPACESPASFADLTRRAWTQPRPVLKSEPAKAFHPEEPAFWPTIANWWVAFTASWRV